MTDRYACRGDIYPSQIAADQGKLDAYEKNQWSGRLHTYICIEGHWHIGGLTHD